MSSLLLVGVAVALCILGAIVAMVASEHAAPRILAIACCTSAVLGFAGFSLCLLTGPSGDVILWEFPVLGPIIVGLTPLAAWFGCVASLVYAATSLFSMRYITRYKEYSLRAFTFWYCLLLGAVLGLFVCRDAISFFIVWELMAVTSSLLVAFEWRREDHSRASFVMLGMSEAGTIAAILAVLLSRGGSLSFAAPAHQLNAALSWTVFLLAFFGFGVKAGLLPINSWLPRAHPVAPGNVSALLSSVVLNAGIYGIVLVDLVLAPVQDPTQGLVVMLVGAATAIVGILYATVADDLKVALAYSSIENMGIAVTGLGVALVFVAQQQLVGAVIGFAALLYHVANHSTYKGLLFLGAATVDWKCGTRSMNALGGVIRVLPVTTALIFVGVLAISSIPPLNGFVSEWLTFQGLLRSAELGPLTFRAVFAVCGAVLALAAALTVTCFVKVFGMSFLGPSRKTLPKGSDAPRSVLVGMGVLAVSCALLGVLPTYVLPLVGNASVEVFGADIVTGTLVPPFFQPKNASADLPPDFMATFHALGAQVGSWLPGRGLVVMLRGAAANPVVFAMSTTYMCLLIAALLLATYGVVRLVARGRRVTRVAPWSGGLKSPLPAEFTYTATGFSNPVRVIFETIFHPTEIENRRETIHEHFRAAIKRARESTFLADRIVTVPTVAFVRRLAMSLARLHHGRLSAYVGYALATLLILLGVAASLRI